MKWKIWVQLEYETHMGFLKYGDGKLQNFWYVQLIWEKFS